MTNDSSTIKTKAVAIDDLDDDYTDNEPAKAPRRKQKNALILPWLILSLAVIGGFSAITAWFELDFSNRSTQQSTEKYQQDITNTVSELINTSLVATQKELNTIATDPEIHKALALAMPSTHQLTGTEPAEHIETNPSQPYDLSQLEALSSTLKKSFNNSVSVQIIPWDISGTAGLKANNIEPKNNIELMLISKSGNNEIPDAEAYLHNKTWLVSFSSPVVKDNSVIGVLLLTFNKKFLTDIINSATLTDNAKLTIYLKQQKKQPIVELGDGTIPYSSQIPLKITDAHLSIAFNAEKMEEFQTSFNIVYIALGVLVAAILFMLVIVYRMTLSFIKNDTHSISNYAESLSGLHQTKQPDLMIPALVDVVHVIDTLSKRTNKTSVTHDVPDNYKSPQTRNVPEKLAIASVSEKNDFEHPGIFKDYDIRGVAETQLTTDAMVAIGKAIGSKAVTLGIKTILTGRDGRLSSEKIQYDLSRGIMSTGCDVINLGQIPTPMLYFATHKLETGAGVMITGSHNPAEYNGVKIILDYKALKGDDIQDLLKRIEDYDFISGQGNISRQDISPEYIQAISSDIIIAKPLKVVLDGCNGVGGEVGTQLLTMLDCEVTPLFCNVDGNFPNHGPDPSIRANLTALVNKVQEIQADIGIAFDGDADRMVAVTASGEVVSGDQLLMLFAKDIVSRNAASNVVYDVKCSRNVEKIVSQYGGRAIMTKSGHSNIKAKMQETGALLGGELTGHFFFKERWLGFDDGIYAALRLIELLTTSNASLDEEIASLPASHATPEIYIPLQQSSQAAAIINKLQESLAGHSCKIDNTDGLRAEFDKGWGLIRASNTSQNLSLRFEAETEEELSRIKELFKTGLNSTNMNLSTSF